MRCYEYYKAKYEKTKPIRGRSTDIRPLDNSRRYRDWERIAKVIVNGQEVYACQLYDTDVVRYYPDGSIGLMIDTWATPSTADFMHCHSPFFACKKYNQIWVYPKGVNVDECYPIPKNTEVKLIPDVEGNYKPEKPVMLTQKVVDRKKSKEARDKIKPFIDWARSFNKLTDGWIMHDTREQFTPMTIETENQHWVKVKYDYKLPDGLLNFTWSGRCEGIRDPKIAYEFLQTCDDDGYMRFYLALCSKEDMSIGQRIARSVSVDVKNNVGGTNQQKVDLCDLAFSWETIQRIIYNMVQEGADVHKLVEVEPTKPITGVM